MAGLALEMSEDRYTREFKAGYIKTVRLAAQAGFDAPEDLAAHAWTLAWEKRAQWTGKGTFISWIITILLNKGKSEFNRTKAIKRTPVFLSYEAAYCERFDKLIDATRVLELVSRKYQRIVRDWLEGQLQSPTERCQVFREIRLAKRKANVN